MSASSFNIFRYAADLLHVLAILFLWQKIHKTRSCSGLSLKSQILFMAVYSTRYLDLFYLRHFDFHHMYNFVMKCLFLGSQATVIYYMVNKYRSTYNPKVDNARMEFILIPCLLLSFFFLPHNPRGSMIFFIREVSLTTNVSDLNKCIFNFKII